MICTRQEELAVQSRPALNLKSSYLSLPRARGSRNGPLRLARASCSLAALTDMSLKIHTGNLWPRNTFPSCHRRQCLALLQRTAVRVAASSELVFPDSASSANRPSLSVLCWFQGISRLKTKNLTNSKTPNQSHLYLLLTPQNFCTAVQTAPFSHSTIMFVYKRVGTDACHNVCV